MPEVLEPVDHALGVLVGDVELVGVVAACGHDGRVEALGCQVVEREVDAVVSLLQTRRPPRRQTGVVFGVQDLGLGQAVLRDSVAEHPARLGIALEDGHVVA